MGIWEDKKVSKNISEVYNRVDEFFENIRESKILEYREGQHTMALDISEVIQNQEVLLIEAGVGIGKSYAYLIPALYATKYDKEFRGFIISTSTIALQEQLKRDIERISELLELSIPVTVAKGKTNYVCLRRIEELMEVNPEKREKIHKILERIQEGDKDRFDFSDLSDSLWNQIHITSCCFENCYKSLNCPYYSSREHFTKDRVIICNHDLLIENLKRESDERILNQPSLLVIDEAHTLEDRVRSSYEHTLDKYRIENLIYNVYSRILNFTDSIEIEQKFFDSLNGFYKAIAQNTKAYVRGRMKKDIDVEDCLRLSFKITATGFTYLKNLINQIEILLKRVKKYEAFTRDWVRTNDIIELEETYYVLKDLTKEKNSQNIYWVEFLNKDGKYATIGYAPREISKLASNLLSDNSYGKVLTSATLTTIDNDYTYYANSIGLDRLVGMKIVKEFSQVSPYRYRENALLYYANDIANPKEKEAYLRDISERIYELLLLTEGRGLILFNAKRDMRIVYDELQNSDYPYPLYMQVEGRGNYLMEKFKEEENASLFGTGTFWEGIDVKGSSLSNLIITRLPFPVVEPVVQAKASFYRDGFREVYLKEMIMRLKQGVGRLIRGEQDMGIISILDSRMELYDLQYDGMIMKSLPNMPRTMDMEVVKNFARNKILSLSK